MDQVINLFEEYPGEGKELEIRLRGIDNSKFENALNYVSNKYGNVEYKKYKEVRIQVPGKKKCFFRCIKFDGRPITYQVKTQIIKHSYYDDWISIYFSIEHEVNSNVYNIREKEVTKERWSTNVGKLGRIDMTKGNNLFQVELELFNARWDFMSFSVELIMVIFDTPTFLRRSSFECVSNIVHTLHGGVFSIGDRKFQKPVVMKTRQYHTIFDEDTLATPKIDGQRRFLITFNDHFFSVDLKGVVRNEGNISRYPYDSYSILDCEYLDGDYHVIDVPVYKNRYVGNEGDPNSRMDTFGWFSSRVPRKPYSKERAFDYKTDGLIFVGRDYMGRCLKLKYENTVDLLFDESLSTSDNKIISSRILGDPVPGKINEFIVRESDLLEFLRARDDKPSANSSRVVLDNMSEEALDMKALEGAGSIMMKRAHNRVKNSMYEGVKGSTLLDIGTGHIDKSKKVFRGISNLNRKIDIVSLFLNIVEDMNELYKVIDSHCSRSCNIIGTYMKYEKDESNECYSISKRDNKRYHVHLLGTRINQVELIVNFGKFRKELEKRGFKVLYHKRMDEDVVGLSTNERNLTNKYWRFRFSRTSSYNKTYHEA